MEQRKTVSVSRMIILILVLLNAIVLSNWYTGSISTAWWLVLTIPLLIIAITDRLQKKHAIIRNYPLIGHLRYFFEWIRPELRQYFIESDTDGKPFSRRQRSIIYQRSKDEKQTVAFGTLHDIQKPGYEWMAHSLFSESGVEENMRVQIGNIQCKQPYHASVLNIGAMSYGALSKTAIQSLNQGAQLGNFAHNTGEGGISSHHLCGGDLIWQIGTGYFGCRNEKGDFDANAFRENALRPEVKMIELKLTQGAKPGLGGILPAKKNTPEIAVIRRIQPATTVHSPARHTAFDSPSGLLLFLQSLRQLSGGKPVGFKICIGDKKEFINIIKATMETGIIPDFICIDGAEGGTGAGPLEFTDHVGMSLYDALALSKSTLRRYNLATEIKIIAAGKIVTGFDILKALSLGASAVYSSRAMMMALGCIQALECDSGKCPTGVATQDPSLYRGLHPQEKKIRVANFHANTMNATKDLMNACGINSVQGVPPSIFFRRITVQETKSFEEIYFPENSSFRRNKIPLN